MKLIYHDKDVVLCVKDPGILSTDEPGGLPDLVRQSLGDQNIRTVHRLDQVVGGLIVLARRAKAASELSRQIREGMFQKEYLAVIQGVPNQAGTLKHLLLRNKQERKTYVVDTLQPKAQEAVLHYQLLETNDGKSLVRIKLETGRTHQIRAQFSGIGMPLLGDKKYGNEEICQVALWSYKIGFEHPYSGEKMEFTQLPPEIYPWNLFQL